jgi:hypothetical protein
MIPLVSTSDGKLVQRRLEVSVCEIGVDPGD